MTEAQRRALDDIFGAALHRVDPARMVTGSIRVDGQRIEIATESYRKTLDLTQFSRIVVLGAGKAGAPMARATEEVLGDRISDGAVVVKRGHTDVLNRIELIEAGHPVPDAQSVAGARRLLELARTADDRTLCICLISGGASALLAAPRSALTSDTVPGPGTIPGPTRPITLTLADLQSTTTQLLNSGATIDEVNTVRKHLSLIKGGGLAAALFPGLTVTLILSDVVGDRLDTIASGPTAPDPTTFADALEVVTRYGVSDRIPRPAIDVLQAGRDGLIEETPKPAGRIFDRVSNVVIGSNAQALGAAAARARQLGYDVSVVTSELTGDVREAARRIVTAIREVRSGRARVEPPACMLFGGETTVTVTGPGVGGRNQELALWMLREMALHPSELDRVAFLSAGTDGTDGPTEAAGAYASVGVARTAQERGLSPDDYLSANDSYTFHRGAGSLLVTGPTNTNVCDIQIALIDT